MKGIIFNAAEDAVTTLLGADTWDALLDSANVHGAYTALGTYPDEELIELVVAASEATGHDPAEVQRLVGRHAIATLISSVEELVDRDKGVFHFLSSIHDIIHLEAIRVAPDATPPSVATVEISDDVLQMTYQSSRGLSPLAEGLIIGSGDYFDEPVTVSVRDDLGTPDDTVFHIHRSES